MFNSFTETSFLFAYLIKNISQNNLKKKANVTIHYILLLDFSKIKKKKKLCHFFKQIVKGAYC